MGVSGGMMGVAHGLDAPFPPGFFREGDLGPMRSPQHIEAPTVESPAPRPADPDELERWWQENKEVPRIKRRRRDNGQ